MIYFEADNSDDLELETQQRSLEVGVGICSCVCEALEQDVDSVIIGLIPKLDMELIVKKEGYYDSLEKNLKRCEEAEEFELCQRIKYWMNKLKNK
jgi:hypothetical protein